MTTDWDRFRSLSCAEAGPSGWRSALALVRGRPFEGFQQAQWLLLEGLLSTVETTIAEVALLLGTHLLEHGEPEGAEWAGRQGLLACPFDERLYRLRMRAAEAGGNRARLSHLLVELARVLESTGDPLEAVHPETAALYRRLAGVSRG